MRRLWPPLTLCLLAWLLAGHRLRHGEEDAARSAPVPGVPQAPQAAKAAPTDTPAPADSPMQDGPARQGPSGLREKRAYVLSLDQGRVALISQQDIEGDFTPARRRPEEWSGMLRCRLVSADDRILAEELLPAPDHLCAVLDPRSGSTRPVSYTVAGPVVFQVRLPRIRDAARLDISRIIQPEAAGQPGLEGSLGSIPLPRS